jgi:type 1 glutamine amidotransferase
MRILLLLLFIHSIGITSAQRILHFTKTSGYDHNTRTVSFSMFQSIAIELGATVDDDATGATFTSANELFQYDVVVFSNTSGADLLDPQQRANFEAYIANGGNVLGIHAASDTYRHSTANGNNTGTWDYYAELIGASVQESPNHVNGTPEYAMQHIGLHASTANLPDPWVKNEEYYYWEGGYYGPDNSVVLQVEATVGPNGQVNSYDAARPMSWYRELPNGSKVFYTGLGHAGSNFTDDVNFRTHITDALEWMLDGTVGIALPRASENILVYPNPTTNVLAVHVDEHTVGRLLQLIDASGQVVVAERLRGRMQQVDVSAVAPGSYVIRIGSASQGRVILVGAPK